MWGSVIDRSGDSARLGRRLKPSSNRVGSSWVRWLCGALGGAVLGFCSDGFFIGLVSMMHEDDGFCRWWLGGKPKSNLEGSLVVCLDLYRDIDWIFFSVVVLAFG